MIPDILETAINNDRLEICDPIIETLKCDQDRVFKTIDDALYNGFTKKAVKVKVGYEVLQGKLTQLLLDSTNPNLTKIVEDCFKPRGIKNVIHREYTQYCSAFFATLLHAKQDAISPVLEQYVCAFFCQPRAS